MIKNYLKIALRNIQNNKVFSGINIIGLSIGLCSSFLIVNYVSHELSFDKYHTNADRIYRIIYSSETYTGGAIARVHNPLGPVVIQEIPEVESSVRFYDYGSGEFEFKERKIMESVGFYSDSTLLDLFDYTLLEGDESQILMNPNSIILTKSLSDKIFNSHDALVIGQNLELDGEVYSVSAILDDVANNSHFTFSFLLPFSAINDESINEWQRYQSYTYVLLGENTDLDSFRDNLANVLKKYLEVLEDDENTISVGTQPLTDIHLHSNIFRELSLNGNIQNIYILSAIAVLLVLIGCINFINLSTSMAAKRAKEVGVRKVCGAISSVLKQQFFFESFLSVTMAFGLAVLLADLLLTPFNTLSGRILDWSPIMTTSTIVVLLFTYLVAVFLAGFYPALYLTKFQPVKVLKGEFKTKDGLKLKKILVVFQFTISLTMITSVLIIQRQWQFMTEKDLGFDRENIISVPLRNHESMPDYEAIKNDLLQHPEIVSVSASGNTLGGGDWGIPLLPEGFTAENTPPIRILVVDHDFMETYGIKIIEGRGFEKSNESDKLRSVIINEEAARQLAWDEPVGKKIGISPIGRSENEVIGITKDFHYRSLHEKIQPLVFIIREDWFSQFSIKIAPGSTSDALEIIEHKWGEIDPDNLFNYSFIDERINALYSADQKLGVILKVFTLITIIIAGLGLIGLSAHNAQNKLKEVSIRKVLGASHSNIVFNFSKDILLLVLISFMLSVIPSWLFFSKWLQNFQYKTNFSLMPFILSLMTLIIILIVIVGYHAIRVSLRNPINDIRAE